MNIKNHFILSFRIFFAKIFAHPLDISIAQTTPSSLSSISSNDRTSVSQSAQTGSSATSDLSTTADPSSLRSTGLLTTNLDPNSTSTAHSSRLSTDDWQTSNQSTSTHTPTTTGLACIPPDLSRISLFPSNYSSNKCFNSSSRCFS